jgi:hypothetical protein
MGERAGERRLSQQVHDIEALSLKGSSQMPPPHSSQGEEEKPDLFMNLDASALVIPFHLVKTQR